MNEIVDSPFDHHGACRYCDTLDGHRGDCSWLLALIADRNFWDKKAGDEHARCLTLEAELARLRGRGGQAMNPFNERNQTTMSERDKELARKLYDLTVQLWEYQGEEIQALKQANQALQRSHDTIGQMLKIVGELTRVGGG